MTDTDGKHDDRERAQGGNVKGTALADSEDRFRLLVQSVVDYGIFMLDANGQVSSWNAGAERINGYTTDEILGQHFSIFYPRADVASGKCDRELEVARSQGRFEDEGWRVRKDGTQFWANVVITPIRDQSGTLLGYGKVTRDLSERRRSEEELRRSEERFRLLVSSVKEYAIFVLDPTGHIATWNAGAQRLKGYSADEIIGQHFSRFYPEQDIRAGKCEMELEQAQLRGSFEDEGWRIRKDGTQFWANVLITPMYEPDGGLFGFAKVTRDLSERKRHEEERVTHARAEEGKRLAELNEARATKLAEDLRVARDNAEEATRVKDEFLATVSHELRTPLNAILGWARLLRDGALDAAKTTHAIDIVVRNAIAQSQIIDDLLDVSRIITGQLRLDIDLVDINHVVSAALDVVRPGAEAKGIRLQWLLNPHAGVIKGDSGRLQQVLWNLLTNAVKFTGRGGRIHVTLSRENSHVSIEVADTGKGLAADFIPHIFERFTQHDSTRSRRTGGLGLGLSIVKHLVELHGGSVEAHSDGEGKGSTFIVRLPVTPLRSARGGTPANAALPQELSYPPELAGLHVLVLDDERDACELVQAVLEQAGANVTLATTSAQALELIRLNKPHVIVSDIGMPEEDGYAFISKLRALSREDGGRIPAVALTAYARADDRRKALLAGFQNHAAKPVEPQELMIVIANLAGRYT